MASRRRADQIAQDRAWVQERQRQRQLQLLVRALDPQTWRHKQLGAVELRGVRVNVVPGGGGMRYVLHAGGRDYAVGFKEIRQAAQATARTPEQAARLERAWSRSLAEAYRARPGGHER